MKEVVLSLLICMGVAVTANAQTGTVSEDNKSVSQADSLFKVKLYNEEFDLVAEVNFYEADVNVPRMEMFGPQPGYLIRRQTNYPWIIAEAEVEDNRTAQLVIINDAGSEDLTATLTCENDSVYVLKQGRGSTIKVPKGNKWMKLPPVITLKTKKDK